jgi:hypothetical protein
MKAKLIFDLDDVDDRQNFQRATQALNLCAALYEVSQVLRTQERHDGPPLTKDKFWEILGENNVDLDQIYS